MKQNANSMVMKLPHEATSLGDDCYLVEMSDRLDRLRTLVDEQGQKWKPKTSWLNLKQLNGFM